MQTDSRQFMTRKEVAEYLNVSVRWLEDNKRIGPPFYILSHKVIRYKRDELANWLKQRKH